MSPIVIIIAESQCAESLNLGSVTAVTEKAYSNQETLIVLYFIVGMVMAICSF